MSHALVLAFTLALATRTLLGSATATAEPAIEADAAGPHSLTELRLPEFQAEAMASDLPVRDLLITPDGSLWALGKTSIWQWQLDAGAGGHLKRWQLHEPKLDGSRLWRLGTDGINVFAASAGTLYQVQLQQERVFRYVNTRARKGRVFGFAGGGDDFWLVHEDGLMRFDRYGKKLVPSFAPLPLEPKDRAVFVPASKRLWVIRGTQLLRIDLATPAPKAKVVLTVKHPLRDLQATEAGLVVSTAHTVLRLDLNGKPRQSLPVEGERKLLSMLITEARHVYLFDDRLVEMFTLKDQSAQRFRLPIDAGETPTKMALKDDVLAVLVDGRPRAFRLDARP